MAWDDDDDFDEAPVRRIKEVKPQIRREKGSAWFRFDLRNIDKTEAALLKLTEDLKDLSPFFRNHFVPAYLQDMQLQFQTEGAFTGGWHGLTPEYEQWKRKHHPGALINQRTRRLVRSFSPGGRSKYLHLNIKPRSVRIQSGLPYAVFVNQLRPILIPPRKLDQKKYSKLLESYLNVVVKKVLGARSTTAGSSPSRPKSFLGFD
jgi:hypothetical protein